MTPATLHLSAETPAEVRRARAEVSAALLRWECGNSSDAVLVFSELVTNAVLHAGGATGITVQHAAETLHLEVRDAVTAVPERRAGGGAGGGFGLNIVAQLCRDWGWTPAADGKVVWADIPCCPDP